MPRFSPFVSLERSLTKLVAERQTHVDALARIDALFSKFGIGVATQAPVADVAVPAPAKATKSGRHKVTGQEFVLSLLNGKSLVTADINKAWIAAGRKGNADTTLFLLNKKKAVKRVPLTVGKGSTYSVA